MKKATIQIAVLAAILLAVCLGCRIMMRGTYTAALPIHLDAPAAADIHIDTEIPRSEEHTSELQSPTHISYAVFCLN